MDLIEKHSISVLMEQLKQTAAQKREEMSHYASSPTSQSNSSNSSNNNPPPPKSSSGSGISITLNATEILKLLITEHFIATCVIILIVIGAIGIFKYDYNFGALITMAMAFLSGTSSGALIIGVVSLLMIGYVVHRINTIIKYNKMHEVIHNTMYNEFNEIRTTVSKMSDRYGSLSNTVSVLTDLISENLIDTRKIISILENINNIIKRIPDKGTIIDLLTIRTKLIFSNIIEVISEYLTSIAMVNRSKRSFTENKLRNKLDEIKIQYLNEVIILSKNTLDNEVRDQILSSLNESFERILFLIINTDDINNIDELLTNIGYIVKSLTVTLTNIYDNNLLLTTFFEEGGVDN